jgi:hypothetical protein
MTQPPAAVVIHLPIDGGNFGVGSYVIADAPLGPYPTDVEWLIHIVQQEPNVQTEWTWRMPWTGTPNLNGIVGRPPQTLQIPYMTSLVRPGGPARVRIDLWSQEFGLQQTGERAIIYDPTSGAPFILQERQNQQIGANANIEQQLRDVTQLSMMGLPAAAIIPAIGVGVEAILGQPRRLLITPDRTGNGQFEPITVPPVLGIGFDVLVVPDFIGHVMGNPTRYSRSILSLTVIRSFSSSDHYIDGIHEFDIGAQYVRLNPAQLVAIQYAIPPGVTIRFYWLTTP